MKFIASFVFLAAALAAQPPLRVAPIHIDAGGPIFAGSAGSPQVRASLPLAEGYTTTFRNFDRQKQKPKLMQLKVESSEKVVVMPQMNGATLTAELQ